MSVVCISEWFWSIIIRMLHCFFTNVAVLMVLSEARRGGEVAVLYSGQVMVVNFATGSGSSCFCCCCEDDMIMII